MKQIKYGLKLWSRNINYIPLIEELVRGGYCDFVEVYVHWQTSPETLSAWTKARVPIRLHAPHTHGGFNPSLKEGMEQKIEILKRVDAYRQALDPSSIVFHPGINGSIEETAVQFNMFKQQYAQLFGKALIENKPKVGLEGEICCGASPEEIKTLLKATGFGFCLDFGHAICYAAWAKLPWERVIDAFMESSPSLFHLSDADAASVIDDHRHFGEGNYDLRAIMGRIPEGSFVTIETKHDHPDHLDDFKRDVDHLKRFVHADW